MQAKSLFTLILFVLEQQNVINKLDKTLNNTLKLILKKDFDVFTQNSEKIQ